MALPGLCLVECTRKSSSRTIENSSHWYGNCSYWYIDITIKKD